MDGRGAAGGTHFVARLGHFASPQFQGLPFHKPKPLFSPLSCLNVACGNTVFVSGPRHAHTRLKTGWRWLSSASGRATASVRPGGNSCSVCWGIDSPITASIDIASRVRVSTTTRPFVPRRFLSVLSPCSCYTHGITVGCMTLDTTPLWADYLRSTTSYSAKSNDGF